MADFTPVVTARGLTKSFVGADGEHIEALSDLTLSMPPNVIVSLVGVDGAGKTTFMRHITGLMKADSGELSVLGINPATDSQAVQDRISYMPQAFGLYEDLSVSENLDLYADLHGVPEAKRKERYPELLAMADLARYLDRPAGKLSGGMKQKLGLICSLVRTPDLLLLDEPSVGVDPLSRRDLWEIVSKLVSRQRISVLWATSYMDEAENSDYVFLLHGGKLIREGKPKEMTLESAGLTYFATPEHGEAPRFLQTAFYDRLDLTTDAVPQGGDVRIIAKEGVTQAQLDAVAPRTNLRPRPPEFEDTFMREIGRTMEQAGADVEYLWCSGDPDSLDGVVIPAIRCAVCDGTSPHGTAPLGHRTKKVSICKALRRRKYYGSSTRHGTNRTLLQDKLFEVRRNCSIKKSTRYRL